MIFKLVQNLIENYLLSQLIEQCKNEQSLPLNAAIRYYNDLKKQNKFLITNNT